MNMLKVVRSCANAQVAHAAVISIGGEFARRVAGEAASKGLSCGSYVAKAVLAFEQSSDLREWARAEQETRGADQPILVGLRHILDRGPLPALEAGAPDDERLDVVRRSQISLSPSALPV